MEDKIIWYKQKNYECSLKTNTTVYFRTIREHLELGYYDTIESILYFNSLYSKSFRKARRQIIKDFIPDSIIEY